jgi:hypothetical protein
MSGITLFYNLKLSVLDAYTPHFVPRLGAFIIHVLESVADCTDIEKHNRALIAFTLLTGQEIAPLHQLRSSMLIYMKKVCFKMLEKLTLNSVKPLPRIFSRW